MAIKKLSKYEELEQILKANENVLLLKNSTTCPISHEAFRQYEKLSNEINDTIYYLNVQESRSASNEVAEKFSIKHESPQVLLFKNGALAWHTSHWNITYKTLKEKY